MVRPGFLPLLALICAACPALAQEALLAPEEARLELILDAPEDVPVEGQMVLATIRGTYSVQIANEELKLRRMTDLDWMRLGQDSWTQRRIEGRSARVMERRIALFPRRAGTVTILPIAHEIEFLGAGRKRQTAIVRSEPVTLAVRPKPAGAGDDWLPARALEISDSWSTDAGRLTNGESAQRRVILRALGATPEMLPGQPPLREPWLITFTSPEDRSVQLTPQGPVTTVVWEWTLRPTTGEPGLLREVVIAWYDTDEDRAKTVRVPAAPIGYESFADNSAASWRNRFGGSFAALGFWFFGAAAALGATAWGRGLASRGGRVRAALGRWRARGALRRLARHRNAPAFRRIATRLLSEGPAAHNMTEHAVLAPLDRDLFGPEGSSGAVDLQALRRAVERHART